MVSRTNRPRKTQTWHAFIQNHAKEVWACDFLTQYTAFFAVAYVFVIMEAGSPLPRPRQRPHLRGIRPVGEGPTGREDAQLPLPSGLLAGAGHGDRKTTDPLRSAEHIRRVVSEFVKFYNGARPSQATHRIPIPDPYPELKKPPPLTGRLVALPVLGGAQRDYTLVA